MYQIRLGLEDKFDVSIYVNPKFNWRQMEKIKKELMKEQEESENKKEEKHSLRM